MVRLGRPQTRSIRLAPSHNRSLAQSASWQLRSMPPPSPALHSVPRDKDPCEDLKAKAKKD